MIFRKPYAFLIKRFKIINIILALLCMFVTYKMFNISDFFKTYISNNYSGNYYQGFSNSYINPFVYLALIVIIVGLIFIISLFIYKKKPSKFYMASCIFYIFLLIYLMFIKNVMVGMEKELLSSDLSRIYRDISLIVSFAQLVFVIYFILQVFGINAKNLNFEKDLKEMEITDADSEEVEITFKGDNVKLKRNFNRFIREFVYYIKENKFIVIIISIVLVVILFFTFYKTIPEIVDHNYSQGQSFNINDLTYTFEDSIITNLDYKGNKIKDSYYLVVRLNIKNNVNKKIPIDYNEFRLEIGDSYHYPVMDQGVYFIDYARNYYSNEIQPNASGTFSLVYKLKDNEVKKKYKIKMNNGTAFSDNFIIGSFNYISITPVVINEVVESGSYKPGEEISLNNTNLGNSMIKISNPNFVDRYIYDYEICSSKKKCDKYKDVVSIDYVKGEKALLIMDFEYEIDKDVPFSEDFGSLKSFVDNFVKIKYLDKNKKLKTVSFKNITPEKMKNQIALSFLEDISKNKEIYFSIIIRNKEFLVRIV